MQFWKGTSAALLLLGLVVFSGLSSSLTARGAGPTLGNYTLNASPFAAQEGGTITLVLTVSGVSTSTSLTWSFRFNVRNPAGATAQSTPQNYTTAPNQDEFSILLNYPSSSFPGSNSLAGKYTAWVDELAPFASTQVATTTFALTLTDAQSYERTLTVNVRASGYNASESVSVVIRTQTSLTVVYSPTLSASPSGIVTGSWPIPKNATIDNYSVQVTGTSTFKSPADAQQFSVRTATMAIPSIASSKSSYQRTETILFTFQPKYPDGSSANTGVGLLTLTRPDRANVTLAATYDAATLVFKASYQTTIWNETGTWTASLTGHAYADAYGNSGPGSTVTNSPQLNPATLTITVATSNTIFAVGQLLKLNATVAYPDGTFLQSGTVGAFLVYSDSQQTVNDTVPVVYDTGLMLWVGTYTPKTSDIGGLWSLVVRASDGASNTGTATRAITIQNSTAGSTTLPLYYYGLLAALIAGILAVGFLAFRRRKETRTSLKIDLEAVHSEASKIEGQEFFKSVKDQVNQVKKNPREDTPQQ